MQKSTSDSAYLFSDKYVHFLSKLKQTLQSAQQKAAMSVNSRMLFAYWQVGYFLSVETQSQAWGAKVVEQIASDLSSAFPNMKGLSKRNLQYMLQFAQEWDINTIAQQLAAQNQITKNEADKFTQQPAAQFEYFEKHPAFQIYWSHHLVLLDKLETTQERLFYCQQIKANNWSRSVLLNQLERKLHQSIGSLPNNFDQTLPKEQAKQVMQTFKDPYFFDFLQLGEEALELDIEKRLVEQITQFLLELGTGFAYLGRQYKLEVGGQEYFLDMLFYHTKLRCYVNIELKIDEFKPEYAGKSQFYLSALNDIVKTDADEASIGILLCKEANHLVVEYALKDNKSPIGVATYHLSSELPENLKDAFPTKAQFKQHLKLKEESSNKK